MNITYKKISVIALLFAITLLTFTWVMAQDQPSGENKQFYYLFDKKIHGRFDTLILAIQYPKEMKSTERDALLESAKDNFLTEEIDYVKAFEQEAIVFMDLSKPGAVDNVPGMTSKAERTGHPFFVDGEKLPVIVTNELIVRFKPEINKEQIGDYNKSNKVEIVKINPHVDNQYVLRVEADCELNALGMANRYQESGMVEFAQPNFLMHIGYDHTPTDADYSDQWHLNNDGSGTMTAGADIDAEKAWDVSRGSNAIVVCAIDGGFEITHPDLDDNTFINTVEQSGTPGVDDDGNGYIDDINGWSFVANSDDVANGLLPYHGQAVAGLVAAEENNQMVVGVAPLCRLLFIANTFDADDLANAFYYARDRGADIITCSWHTSEQAVLVTAIRETANGTRGGLGISIFVASGNGGTAFVSYPARDSNTIAVGGSDCTDIRYCNSQYGPELSVLAPTRQCGGDCGLVTTGLGGGITSTFGGTSGATPITAGTAALLLTVNPNLTRYQVRDILQATAEKIDADTADYNSDGFSDTHGYGRINAHRAIVPSVTITAPKRVTKGAFFTVKVTASAPFGLKSLWWFGQGTGIPDIDKAHMHTVGGEVVYTYEWTDVAINKKGTFTLGANARDVLYPNPVDGFPHQASEGSGIATTEIRVTPVTPIVGFGLIWLSFLVTGIIAVKKRNQ